MNLLPRKKVIVLGMMSRHPVAGVVWQTLHYLVGFERLGYEVYYVEAHAAMPTKLMRHEEDDAGTIAAAFIDGVLRRFDLGDRWAFQALYGDGRSFGLSERQLDDLYRSADLVINLHGATPPRPEHYETNNLIYLETDPVALQIELHDGRQDTVAFLEPHRAFFTFGENYGNPDCGLPVSNRFSFKPTRQPVVMDFWQTGTEAGELFTTIGNWRQIWLGKEVTFRGELYHWSKHYEFLKFIDLPARTPQHFELALSSGSVETDDLAMLERHGWLIRDSLDFSEDLDEYRDYIVRSRGEFTVAKDQNIRLRSGWFSDRAATYLAAGRPVITQETGFSNVLPTGAGLFGFSTMEEILQAVAAVNGDYERQSRSATEIAHDCFNYDVVLPRLLEEVGL